MRLSRLSGAVLVSSLLGFGLSAFASAPKTLTFEDRVKAQEAIERVYYNHRIWPKENPKPKPPFEQMVPRSVIEAKVTDYLKKCAALDKYWQRPIQPEQLKAEMDRMAKGTKDPATLIELFAALNNDPYLIAECLARPILAERLIQDWYAYDTRFHQEAREKAERALKEADHKDLLAWPEGDCSTTTYKLSGEGDEPEGLGLAEKRQINLAPDEFDKMAARYPEIEKLHLSEEREAFQVARVASKKGKDLTVESLVFAKRPFEIWWAEASQVLGVTGTPGDKADGRITGDFHVPETVCADQWTATSLGAVPSDRNWHTAVWTGTEMIVWGGYYSGYLNTGGRYSPSTDTWAATSAGTNCPSARSGHTAVWTGSIMVVWGGRNDSSYFNTGGRYDPSADTWAATSTGTNLPYARDEHTAVWTGTEMIVCGGFGPGNYQNTGGKYDPSNNGWTQTSSAWSQGRIRHTAVWTGKEMVVWGGYNVAVGSMNSGARYNPTTDSWTVTSTGASCPAARDAHTAVWTGTEMIVWGGYGSKYFSDGGRYNPYSDTWTATSTGTNCPSGRKQHTAVWTGTEMIVWGGYSPTNTGGRYSPSSDSWAATTGTNCPPPPRYGHTAVWTGTMMIIWGSAVAGGIYRPPFYVYGLAGVCTGGSATLSISPDATGLPCQWYADGVPISGASGATLQASATATYTVSVDDGSGPCTTDGFLFTAYPPPSPTVLGVDSGCAGQDIWLWTQSYQTYQWIKDGTDIPGATAFSYRATLSGTYSVRVMDANGCVGTTPDHPLTVYPNPTPMISGPASACASAGGALSTGSYSSYQWKRNGSPISGATSQSYTATQSGTYTVAVTDANGCQATSAGFPITIYNPSPTISGPNPACLTASLSTQAYSAYQWYRNGSIITGATSQSYSAPTTGSYTVLVTESHGCQATSPAFVVSANPSPVISGPSSGCPSVLLSTTAFSAYQWAMDGTDIPGATSQSYSASLTGTYTVRVTSAAGCQGTSSGFGVTIGSGQQPTVTGPHNNNCPATTATISTGSFTSYQWRFNGTVIPGAAGQSYEAGVSGNYSVTTRDVSGCLATSTDYAVFVDFCPASEVSPATAIFPARLVKNGSSPTGYYLYFQRLDTLDGYNVYEGTMGTFYSHANAPGNVCNVTVTDLGTGEMRAAITPSAGDHYYLVTAYGGGSQGPSGFDSNAVQIPAGQSTCPP